MNNVKLVWILGLSLLLICGAGWYSQRLTRPLQRMPTPRPLAIQPNSAPRLNPRLDSQQVEAQATPLRTAIAAHPQDLRPRWALVALYGQTGQADKAAAEADAIERQHPAGAPNLLALGNTRMLLHQYDKAERAYRQALARQAALPAAQQGLATALYKQERYYEAMQAAQRAVTLSPKDSGAHLALALSAMKYGQRFSLAEVHGDTLTLAQQEFLNLTKTMPGNADILYLAGQASVAIGDYDTAKSSFSQALALSPRLDIYQELARADLDSGSLTEAQKVVDSALARYPNDAALHDLRGRILLASAVPDSDTLALPEFQKAAQIQPQSALFQQRLGTAYLRAGNLPEAHAAFAAAIRLDPNDALPFQQIAAVYARLGDTARAKAAAQASAGLAFNAQQLKQVLSLAQAHPDSVPLHLILADRYRDLKQAGAARDEYLLVLHLDPANERAKQGLDVLKANE